MVGLPPSPKDVLGSNITEPGSCLSVAADNTAKTVAENAANTTTSASEYGKGTELQGEARQDNEMPGEDSQNK
jgi:hypothetical protein